MSLVIYAKVVRFHPFYFNTRSLTIKCLAAYALPRVLCTRFCPKAVASLTFLANFFFFLKYPWHPPCLRIHLKEFVISARACCYKLLIFASVQIFVDLELESELRAQDEDRGNGGQDCASDSVPVSETSDASIVPNSRKRRGSVTISVFGQVCWNITCTLL